MSSFDKYTNYNDQAGVSGVVFGANKSVLEVELNEVQEINQKLLRNMIAKVCGDGITDITKITYENGIISIASDCSIAVDGIIINCTGLSMSVSSGAVYLQVWEEIVDYNAVLKKEGNQDGDEVVDNYIKDSRTNEETTRRKVVKYTLATSQDNSRHNLLIATILSEYEYEINVHEIDLVKLKTDFDNTIKDLNSELGVIRDLIDTNIDDISILQRDKINKSDIDSSTNLNSTNPISNKAITAFVNSSIATNTADFLGTYDSLESLKNNTGSAANNDYAFVRTIDEDGNTIYNRYKYSANTNTWSFEYALNNSSFTAEQWSAINSGINSDDKLKLDGIETGANKTTVDSALSTSSTNPVQNKIITNKLNKLDSDVDNLSNNLQTAYNKFANYLPLTGGTVTGTTTFSHADYMGQLEINRASTASGAISAIDYLVNNSYVGILGFDTDSRLRVKNSSDTDMLIVNSNGNGVFAGSVTATKFNDYILGAACAKGVDTTAISGSSNLITSGAMYTALSGKVESTSAGVSTALNKLSTGTAIPVDEDYYISQYSGGGTTTTTYHRRPVSALYSYMKKKMDSVYLPLSGNASSATKWATARNINGMSVNGTANRVNYGTCSTAASIQAKIVDCPGFALITGAEITVKFTETVAALNSTLNVNGTGNKAIMYKGSNISPGKLLAGSTYTFRYNGTQYDLVGDLNTDTDTKVHQTNSTADSDYRVLLSYSAVDSTEGNSVKKSSKLTFNPSTGELKKTGDSPINSSYGGLLCSMYADMAIASKQLTITYEQFSKHNLLLWTLLEDDSQIYHEGIIPVKYLISNGSWEVRSSSNGSLIVRFTIKTDTSSNSNIYFQTYSSAVNLKIYSLI